MSIEISGEAEIPPGGKDADGGAAPKMAGNNAT